METNKSSSTVVFISAFIISLVLNYTIEPSFNDFTTPLTIIFLLSLIVAMLYRIIELLDKNK
ncbi:hypothetical protein [Clostridium sp. Ade.TY]|uniref:hypothetical protein n=1 Tax=Clostridium sp. Ade.TY TaxID=1391647 RepID=UPI000463042B|nr:hypothetical protein [Clostridium sp. Ade.TY]